MTVRPVARPADEWARLRNGTVQTVDTAAQTVTVTLGGATGPVDAHYLGHVLPRAGQPVKVLQHRRSLLVIGSSDPAAAGGAGISLKGHVATVGALPKTAKDGDTWLVEGSGDLYVFNGGTWASVGHVVGPAGPRGATGPAGSTGASGPQGTIGDTGPAGTQGPVGMPSTVPGPTGPKGATGPQGPQGPSGKQGPQGVAGATGPKGDTGDPGPSGPSGPQGPDGPVGQGLHFKSAVTDPAHLPPTGTVGDLHLVSSTGELMYWDGAAWRDLGHLAGPQGQRGLQGTRGPNGRRGPTGPRGTTGARGIQGPAGAQGVKGDPGAIGPQGPTGGDGPQGPQGERGEGIHILGAVATQTDLPAGAKPGDAHLIVATGDLAIWDGHAWRPVGHVAGPPGMDGIQGPAGAQGPTGPKGPAGPAGATGGVGATGDTGPKGDPGADGADGHDGAQGIAGTVGPAGPKGATGAKGRQGQRGPAGPIGHTGPAGHDGTPGAAGPKGDQGLRGPAGAQGATGPRGEGIHILSAVATQAGLPKTGNKHGDAHLVTSTGDLMIWGTDDRWHDTGHVAGPPGSAGIQGPAGAQGPIGHDGAEGPRGPAGHKGDPGIAGHDGATGAAGAAGATGPRGPKGNQGAVGPKGDKGDRGLDGSAGATGPTGATGPRGPQDIPAGGTLTIGDPAGKHTELVSRSDGGVEINVKDGSGGLINHFVVNEHGTALYEQPLLIHDGIVIRAGYGGPIIAEQSPSGDQTLRLGKDPVAPLDAATKDYVDKHGGSNILAKTAAPTATDARGLADGTLWVVCNP